MRTVKQRPRGVWSCLLGCAVLGLGFSWNAFAACDPAVNGDHVDCIGDDYTGPEVCVSCHIKEAVEMHGSVHYQQNGPTDFVTNIDGLAGERGLAVGETGINTYCGTHENSPRFTCAGCHVGNGRFPMAQSAFEQLDPASAEAHAQLANIDCMICHQEIYRRFPDPGVNASDAFVPLTLFNVTEEAGELVEKAGSIVIRGGEDSDPIQGIPVVDAITLDFQFVPADPIKFPALAGLPDRFKLPDGVTAELAAETVHPTTRTSCLNCHAGAGGGDGTKRGDMSSVLRSPSVAIDQHMAPREQGGRNLSCSDCHNAGGHRVRGRGLDLRPNDVPERFTCDNSGCHSSRPHGDFSNTRGGSRDKHALKVACQSCHIPTYAKGVKTETARDWLDPHLSQTACNGRGGWLPHEYKGGDGALPEETLNPFNVAYQSALVPSYAWFDGTSEVYYLGEPLADVPTVPLTAEVAAAFDMSDNEPAFVLGMPNGAVTGGTSTKLYPMKEHWGKLAMRTDTDPETGSQTRKLVGHSTFEFFRTGSFCRAVAVGTGDITSETPAGADEPVCGLAEPGDVRMPPNITVVPVHTYQTINHGVEREENALACGACHSQLSGGPVRMDLRGELGYELRTGPSAVRGSRVSGTLDGNLDRICRQCHDNEREDRDFRDVHRRHVEEERKDCAACHNFTRPERNLDLTRDD